MTGRRPRAVVLAALTLLAAMTALGAPATAATPAPTPTTSAAGQAAGATPTATPASDLSVSLVSIAPRILTLSDDLTVTVNVTNSGPTALPGAIASLELSRYRLTSRADLDAWADGTTPTGGASVLARTSLDAPLDPGTSATLTLHASASAIRLANVWGPRGLQVEVSSGSDQARLRTYLLWQSTEQIPQAQVALVAPVVGPAGRSAPAASGGTTAATPADDAAALGSLIAPHGRLDRLLTAARAVPELGLAVDPALLAQAGAAGPADQPWVTGVKSALADGREALALPWADPDVAALGGTDDATLLTQARTMSSAAYPGASGDLAWSADAQVDSGTADVVRASGATRLLLPGAAHGTAGVATMRTGAGALTVLRSDAELDALATGSSAGTAAGQQQALAMLAVAARDGAGGDRVLIAAPRDWTADPTSLAALVGALRSAPWVHLTSTAALATTGDPAVVEPSQVGGGTNVLAPGPVSALTDARTQLGALATAADDPSAVTGGLDDSLLLPLAVAWRADPDGRTALIATTLDSADQRLGALSLTPRANITVISASSDVRFTIRNDLTTGATVRVRVTPSKVCLTTQLSDPVTVPARTEASVPVHFEAHANCQVRVSAELVAEDGTSLSRSPLVFTASLSPTIENVGTAVVGAVLAVGLLLGIIRTVRRGQSGRRGARQVPPDEPSQLGVLGGEPPGRPRPQDEEPPG